MNTIIAIIVAMALVTLGAAYLLGMYMARKNATDRKEKIRQERKQAIEQRKKALEFLRNKDEQVSIPNKLYNFHFSAHDIKGWSTYHPRDSYYKEIPISLELVDTDEEEIRELLERYEKIRLLHNLARSLRSVDDGGFNVENSNKRNYDDWVNWLESWEGRLTNLRKEARIFSLSIEKFETSDEELNALLQAVRIKRVKLRVYSFQKRMRLALQGLIEVHAILSVLKDAGCVEPEIGILPEGDDLERQIRAYLKYPEEQSATQ